METVKLCSVRNLLHLKIGTDRVGIGGTKLRLVPGNHIGSCRGNKQFRPLFLCCKGIASGSFGGFGQHIIKGGAYGSIDKAEQNSARDTPRIVPCHNKGHYTAVTNPPPDNTA